MQPGNENTTKEGDSGISLSCAVVILDSSLFLPHTLSFLVGQEQGSIY